MLPRAEAAARRLPYTTADMAERLAKRKAEQDAVTQALANQALRFGVTNPPIQEDKGGGGGLWPSWGEIGNAIKSVGNTAKSAGNMAVGTINTIAATPLDIADEAVQGLERVMGVKPTDKFDPASIGSYNLLGETYRGVDRAANYVGKQIAAIPGFGKPSSSPFMDTVRSQGWLNAIAEPFVHGANVASVAFPISKVAGAAKLPGTIADAYRRLLLERDIAAQNNLFPAVQQPANFIDVVEDSRLPASTQRALPPAEIAPTIAELPPSRLTPPAWRERQVPTSSRLTVETDGPPDPQASQEFVIRAFDNTSDEYKGALTMYWDPIKQKAIVYGMGATDAMVTPQLVSSAAYIIRKYYGDIPFPLEPSRNLSAYSRPFVERLQKAGLVDPNFILPEAYELNSIDKAALPEDFADEFSDNSEIIPSLAYQPTYNDVLRALVESKQKAKLEGEYGKLATSSQKLQELKWNPNKLNTAEMYRSNMDQYGFPVHPLFNLFGDEWNNNLLNEIITYPFRGASSLFDAWKKIDPAIVENLGSTWGPSFAPTKQNLLKFPQLLQDSNLIDGFTRQRLLVELQDLLE